MASLLTSLAEVKAKWPMRGWSFDNRFMCVASTFGIDMAEKCRECVAAALPHMWNSRNIEGAPLLLREIASRTGGVRAGQQVFASDLVSGAIAYGLWWPWEEGSTISLRIGLEGPSDMTMALCNTFGVQP